jgi:hypothetical protein
MVTYRGLGLCMCQWELDDLTRDVLSNQEKNVHGSKVDTHNTALLRIFRSHWLMFTPFTSHGIFQLDLFFYPWNGDGRFF